jgi:hypothetical protein
MSEGDVEPTDSPPDMMWHTDTRQTVLPEPLLPSPAKSTAGELAPPSGPRWAIAAGGLAVAVSLLVLAGWAFDIDAFKSVLSNSMTMKPNTAVSLMTLGISMMLAVVPRAPYVPHGTRLVLARVFAAIPLLIGFITLLEYVAEIDLFIDQLMFRDAVIHRGGPFPGRISPATSACTMLLSLSLLTLDARSTRLRRFSQWPALIAAALSFVAVLEYLYGAQQMYQIRPYATVAVHTAILSVALGVGFVLARPDRSIARELFSLHHGGLMARRVLPLAILLPMIVGWLRLEGQKAGWYQTEIGLALFAVTFVINGIARLYVWRAKGKLGK